MPTSWHVNQSNVPFYPTSVQNKVNCPIMVLSDFVLINTSKPFKESYLKIKVLIETLTKAYKQTAKNGSHTKQWLYKNSEKIDQK